MCVAAASPRWRSCNDADEWDPKVDCATVASDTTMTRKVRVRNAHHAACGLIWGGI